MATATFRVWRGDKSGGEFKDYTVEVGEGMVVLDCVHTIQATHASDLACRWNCKAGKCGSCSAEINGKPRLMCMTRMDSLPTGETIILQPLKTFPLMKDLVTDVSWNYKVNKMIPPFTPRPPDGARRIHAVSHSSFPSWLRAANPFLRMLPIFAVRSRATR